MNRKWIYLLLVVFFLCKTTHARCSKNNNCEIEKQTYVFAIKGSDTLSLDKYEAQTAIIISPKPVVIFAFGGGFKGGDKASNRYIPYFHFLAENGFVVISTDYRTTLKNLNPQKVSTPADFVALLQNAIQTAVEDFFDATRFVIDHSKDWNINPELVIASGSSAGAVTTLQAEYEICNQTELTSRLPDSFNYAGVVAFAGAISCPGPLTWKRMPCPMMMFHGDADRTVPYEKAVAENLGGLWGSASIVGTLNQIESSYYFYNVENAGHEIADLPMKSHTYDILSFVTRQVLEKQKLAIVTNERIPGVPHVKKHYSLSEYIQNNL